MNINESVKRKEDTGDLSTCCEGWAALPGMDGRGFERGKGVARGEAVNFVAFAAEKLPLEKVPFTGQQRLLDRNRPP